MGKGRKRKGCSCQGFARVQVKGVWRKWEEIEEEIREQERLEGSRREVESNVEHRKKRRFCLSQGVRVGGKEVSKGKINRNGSRNEKRNQDKGKDNRKEVRRGRRMLF